MIELSDRQIKTLINAIDLVVERNKYYGGKRAKKSTIVLVGEMQLKENTYPDHVPHGDATILLIKEIRWSLAEPLAILFFASHPTFDVKYDITEKLAEFLEANTLAATLHPDEYLTKH